MTNGGGNTAFLYIFYMRYNEHMYEMSDNPITKTLVFFNQETYEKALESSWKNKNNEEEKLTNYLLNKNDESFVLYLVEAFNDALCPVCRCPTISNVVQDYTNRFIYECVACKAQFNYLDGS